MRVRVRVLRGRLAGPDVRDRRADGRDRVAADVHGGLPERGGRRMFRRRRRHRCCRRQRAVGGRRAVARVSARRLFGRPFRKGRVHRKADPGRRVAGRRDRSGGRGQLRAGRGPRHRRRPPGRGQRRHAGHQPPDHPTVAAAAPAVVAGSPRRRPVDRHRRPIGPPALAHHRAGHGQRVPRVRRGPHGRVPVGRGARHVRGRGRVPSARRGRGRRTERPDHHVAGRRRAAGRVVRPIRLSGVHVRRANRTSTYDRNGRGRPSE